MTQEEVGKPERVGPYRIVEEIGRGGMGVVYRAHQETPVERDVAVKIVRAGLSTQDDVARFEIERQALAVMDHVGIATVHDAGVTNDGRPYFVMELLDGEPLTAYCDHHRLSVRRRVEIFCAICDAVHHAHLKGVIHRDLKPSNVLVVGGATPLPKVIDFGVAKVSGGDASSGLTHSGLVLGTPAYMSPEQLDAASDVDSRTDVYALGMMLYELLVGLLPFDSTGHRGWALLARVERDPPRPSARVAELPDTQETIARSRSTGLSQLRSQLGGDLDWIVMKAIERSRDRRYDSASQLAADLRRFLRHDPVSARPPDLGYRVGKFVRRHRVAVTGALAFLTAMVGGLATTTYFWRTSVRRAEVAESRAMAAAVAPRVADDPTGALLLAIGAAERAPTFEAEEALRLALEVPQPRAVLRLAGSGDWRADFSTDGGLVMTADGYLPATMWDADTGLRIPLTLDGRELPAPDPSVAYPGGEFPLAFTPDGARVLTQARRGPASQPGDAAPGRMRIWDVVSGDVRTELGEADAVSFAVFGPEGARLVTVETSSDQGASPPLSTAKLWDAGAGELLAVLRVPSDCGSASCARPVPTPTAEASGPFAGTGVRTLSAPGCDARRCARPVFSPDGTLVATADPDESGVVRLWSAATGLPVARLSGHVRRVLHLEFSPDGRMLVSAGMDRTARIWDVARGEERRVLSGHSAVVDHAAFSPDGRVVVTASRDGTARTWDAGSGTELTRLVGHQGWVTHAEFDPSRSRVVTTGQDRQARIWDLGTRETIAVLPGHESNVTFARYDSSAGRLITAGEDYAARIWQVPLEEAGLRDPSLTSRSRPAMTAEGARFLGRGPDGAFGIVDVESRETRARVSLPVQPPFLRTLMSPTGERALSLAAARADLWDAATGELVTHLTNSLGEISPLGFSGDGSRVAAGLTDGSVVVWDAASGDTVARFDTGHRRVMQLTMSEDGRHAVTWTDNIMLSETGEPLNVGRSASRGRLWQVDSGALVSELGQDNSGPASFSKDGSSLALSSMRSALEIWDVARGVRVAELGEREIFSRLAFSEDGDRVAASAQGRVTVWSVSEDRIVTVLDHRNAQPIRHIEFSKDGRLIVTASSDGTVRLWDSQTGTERAVLRHEGPARYAGLDRDARRLVTFADGGSFEVHLVRLEDLLERAETSLPITMGPAIRDSISRSLGIVRD